MQKRNNSKASDSFEQQQNADRTPRKEGGEDSVENIDPSDSRADEKVVANTPKANPEQIEQNRS